MKPAIQLCLVTILLFSLSFCKNKQSLSEKHEDCVFTYNAITTQINFTAYKYTSKAAVKGKLDKHKAQLAQSASSVLETLKGLKQLLRRLLYRFHNN